jgi:multiple sugar transport system permease protein
MNFGKCIARTKRYSVNSSRAFYVFISPWLLGFLLFTLFPMAYSFYTSFTDWNGVQAPVFTGFQNFINMFTADKKFWLTIRNTFYYALVTVPLNMILALFLASFLNKHLPGTTFFRSVFYLPAIISGTAVYIAWQFMLDPVTGVFNTLLANIGIQGPDWLRSKVWAMPALILMNTSTCGGAMLILLAGLQDIPQDYYEAALVDGASNTRIFYKITLPLLTPVIFFNVIMGIIGALQIFAQVMVMTAGGPVNSTYVYALYLYQTAFRYTRFGYASALAWVLFIIILVMSLLIFKSSSLWVHSTEEVK